MLRLKLLDNFINKMKTANYLSIIGRSGYWVNMLVLPGVFGLYKLVYVPHQQKKELQAKEEQLKNLPKARKVDPDLMNPFTPIPYHNNYELKFAQYHLNMHNYLNENGINVQDFPYKNYHDSFNDSPHLYNWTSVYGPPGFDEKFRKEHGSSH